MKKAAIIPAYLSVQLVYTSLFKKHKHSYSEVSNHARKSGEVP